MGDGQHPRLHLPAFLPLDLCKQLEFVHKSCSTVGYRPNVFSTTLSHLIATNSAHLIMSFVLIRDRLKEKVEEFFDCQYELFIEFTGLISWTKGARIGWHSDDNRPYLKQRDFAAVCYLNSHGKDFGGGIFHFQDGKPISVVPMAGDVLIYTADSRNVHSVDEITEGERLTLTVWFTRDCAHDEDVKLIALLSERLLTPGDDKADSYLPVAAPSNMYWFSPDSAASNQLGFDIRWARVHILGYDFYTDDIYCNSTLDSSFDPLELLIRPLYLAREDEVFKKDFLNSLHALQVVQFYYWKASELQATKLLREASNTERLTRSLEKECNGLKLFADDNQLTEGVSGQIGYCRKQPPIDWTLFSAAVAMWEDHICRLHRKLFISLPYWKSHQTIFAVDLAEQ